MKKIFTATTTEEAMELAVKEFGVSADKIEFSVLKEAKKGLFGKIKSEAEVEATYNPTKEDIAKKYLKEILEKMEIDADVSANETEDGINVEILGETTGAVIGRRGETLDALQYLVSMTVNKNDGEYTRITLDCCGYRDKRKAILEELAQKISRSVIKTGRTSSLEPMNPYERRIIHSAIADIEGVTSKSSGEEPYRKVVISSTTPRKREYNKDNRNNGGKNGGKGRYGNKDKYSRDENVPLKAIDMMKSSFEKEYKKPKPEDNLIAGDLYGKIDV